MMAFLCDRLQHPERQTSISWRNQNSPTSAHLPLLLVVPPPCLPTPPRAPPVTISGPLERSRLRPRAAKPSELPRLPSCPGDQGLSV